MSETQPEDEETSEKFYRLFQTEATSLQQHIDRLGDTFLTGGERTNAFDYCVSGIQRLSAEVKNASVYIPSRDQKTYLDSLKNLSSRLQLAREAVAPKPKFSFKSARKRPTAEVVPDTSQANPDSQKESDAQRYEIPCRVNSTIAPIQAQSNTGVVDLDDPAYENGDDKEDVEMIACREATIRKRSFSQDTSVIISNERHSHIILPLSAAHATSTGILTNVRRCVVDMSIPTAMVGRPFAALTVKNVKDSLIICGHVAGAIHVTKLENSVIVVACRQFRMHECKRCDVYLHLGSRPIIEDCEQVRFAPLPEYYKAQDGGEPFENLWDHVDDFKWLKSGPSPNWTILPAEKRVSDTVWTETVPARPGYGVSDILTAVGIARL